MTNLPFIHEGQLTIDGALESLQYRDALEATAQEVADEYARVEAEYLEYAATQLATWLQEQDEIIDYDEEERF